MKKSLLIAAISLASLHLHAEQDQIILRFSSNHSCTYMQPDSISIENLTQGSAKTLYYPDTMLLFVVTDVGMTPDMGNNMHVFQNYPNPFSGQTTIELYLPEGDDVSISVVDLTGRKSSAYQSWLDQGTHRFTFHACNSQIYILNVMSKKYVQQRLMIQLGKGGEAPRLEHNGYEAHLQLNEVRADKSASDDLLFDAGDMLRFTCYVTDLSGHVDQGVITDTPDSSRDYLFDIFSRPPRQPSVISGLASVPHLESGLVYEVDPVPGVTFHWTVPAGWEITHGQGMHTITVDAGTQAGNIRVAAENNCGFSPNRSMSVTVETPEPDTFEVSFQVDLSAAMHSGALQGFDPGIHTIYFTGNMVSWAVPGSNPDLEMEKISDDPVVYEKILSLEAGTHEYKYFSDFIGQGWDGGEWAGEPNRVVIVEGDTTVFDYWGTLEIPDEPDDPDYSALIVGIWKMAPMEGALSVYPADRSVIYWQSSQQDLVNMACFFDDEYWLYEDGTFKNKQGEETWLEPWQNEEQQYRCDTPVPPHDGSAEATWTVSEKIMTIHGRGAYIGFPKVIYNDEIDNPEDAPEEIMYPFTIIEATKHDPMAKDTMVIEIPIKGGEQFWKFILVKETDDVPDDPDDPDDHCDFGTLTDIDGNSYHTIIIGEQEWMAENLRTTRYHDGTAIATGLTADQWRYTTQGAYTVYPHESIDGIGSQQEMLSNYGALYNWYTTVDTRTLCPAGWRVPTHFDWVKLEQGICNLLGNENCDASFPYDYTTFLWRGTNEGQALKSCRQVDSPLDGNCNITEHPRWDPDNTHYGTNEFCFSALPAGAFGWTGDTVASLGEQARWWTSTEHISDESRAIIRVLFNDRSEIGRSANPKGNGFSIRCIRGEPSFAVLPGVTTAKVSEIRGETAKGGGQVTSDGGAPVTDRGIVYSKKSNPNITDHVISSGEGIGSFVCIMTGLEPATTYYVRAFATNRVGTAYGKQESFESAPLKPTEPEIGWANLQWPPEGSITVGSPFVVYARVFIEELTGPGATPEGLADLSAWIGCSKTDASSVSDFTQSDWTWVTASLNDYAAMFGPNSEYSADIGSTIGEPGTYYYVSRFQLGTGEYLYGGYGEGFWDGTNSTSCSVVIYEEGDPDDPDDPDIPLTGIPCPDMPTVTDIDGNVYNTVLIGDQCWMKENLKTTRYADNTPILTDISDARWVDSGDAAYVWYNDDIGWKDKYGALYNWMAVNNSRGLCPTGWRVPGGPDIGALRNHMMDHVEGTTSSNIGHKLKSCRNAQSPLGEHCATSHHPRWVGYEFIPGESGQHTKLFGTDDVGFSALPGGYRDEHTAMYWSLGGTAYFWSATEIEGTANAYAYYIDSSKGWLTYNQKRMHFGFSVRCIRETPKYTLNLIVVPAGTGAVTGSGEYEAGESVSIMAYPSTGYRFVRWRNTAGQTVSTSRGFTFSMPASNRTLYADFEEEEPVAPKYTLNLIVVPAGTGAVTGSGEYEAGASVSIMAYPSTGYRFVRWRNTAGQTVSTNRGFTLTMPASNLTLYADFEQEPVAPKYTLSLGVIPAGGGTTTGAGQYEAGTMVTISATPAKGYMLEAWKNSHGQTVSIQATFSHEMPAFNVVLYAHFKEATDVTNPKTGKTWMDRNLGASRAATSSTDAQAYGDLYQWGRDTDGHQIRTSGTTSTLSSSNTPGHGNFITVNTSPHDWRSPQNDNLWQGVNGINNPCPSGYRLPTEAELNAERQSWSSNNAKGAFASPLKLTVGGGRLRSDGSLFSVGAVGFYWSSALDGSRSRSLFFNNSNAGMSTNIRAYGLAVRCIKD